MFLVCLGTHEFPDLRTYEIIRIVPCGHWQTCKALGVDIHRTGKRAAHNSIRRELGGRNIAGVETTRCSPTRNVASVFARCRVIRAWLALRYLAGENKHTQYHHEWILLALSEMRSRWMKVTNEVPISCQLFCHNYLSALCAPVSLLELQWVAAGVRRISFLTDGVI